MTLSAWGTAGPWGGRRGFDSLVQIAAGIGWATSPDDERPGKLPFQLLDHATGYLAAAAALTALARRHHTGEATHSDLSLVATANWLLSKGSSGSIADLTPVEADVAGYRTPLGDGWLGISPPGRLDGQPLSWPHLPPRYGRANALWA